jgi:hypothetical protein
VVRENAVLFAGCSLKDTSTPGNCVVFDGKGHKPAFKELLKYDADSYFIREMAGLE